MTTPSSVNPLAGERGFTLIELLMVSALLGVLGSIALSAFSNYKQLAQDARAISELRNIDKNINAYLIDKGSLPDDLSDLGLNPPIPRDPWGNPYKYYKFSKGGDTPFLDTDGITQLNTDYDLYSKGANGLTAQELTLGGGASSQDDVVRAHDGMFFEVGYKFFLP